MNNIAPVGIEAGPGQGSVRVLRVAYGLEGGLAFRKIKAAPVDWGRRPRRLYLWDADFRGGEIPLPKLQPRTVKTGDVALVTIL